MAIRIWTGKWGSVAVIALAGLLGLAPGLFILARTGLPSPKREQSSVASRPLPATSTASPATVPSEPKTSALSPLPAPQNQVARPPKPAEPPKPAAPPIVNPRVTRAAFDRIQWLMPCKDIESILGKGEPVADSFVLRAMGPKPVTNPALYGWVEGGLFMRWKGKDLTIFAQFGGPTVVENRDGSYSVGPNTQCTLALLITENPRGDVETDWKVGSWAGRTGPQVDNPRVTPAAFDRIQWYMPSKDVENILGKGELVDNSVVLGALGPPPGTSAWLCEEGERGLWVQWKFQNRTLFVQFSGPTVVQNKDGLHSIGPNTQCGLALFVTENPSGGGMREVDIDYKLGPRRGHIHRIEERRSIVLRLK